MEKHVATPYQSEAFSELANLLHARRQKVAELVARKQHPLPLPQHSGDAFLFDASYRLKLRKWIREERNLKMRGGLGKSTLSLIEKELERGAGLPGNEVSWSIDSDLEKTPPGHYLG